MEVGEPPQDVFCPFAKDDLVSARAAHTGPCLCRDQEVLLPFEREVFLILHDPPHQVVLGTGFPSDTR